MVADDLESLPCNGGGPYRIDAKLQALHKAAGYAGTDPTPSRPTPKSNAGGIPVRNALAGRDQFDRPRNFSSGHGPQPDDNQRVATIQVDIPLLRESVAYSARLARAVQALGESRYVMHRRINWSHRYADRFYAGEATAFIADSGGYIADALGSVSPLEDVFRRRLTWPMLRAVVLKTVVHWLFAIVGRVQGWIPGAFRAAFYRKAYVDDIELVFDPEAADTMRAVYPFPLSLKRQLRYFRRLLRERRHFRLAGHGYLVGDFVQVLRRRDIWSVMRLEARAQLRHARDIARQGYMRVEMSDEFNLGSLEFTRMLRRARIPHVNRAHGVGKYLPVHAYEHFTTLTDLQENFYIAVLPCRYDRSPLNDASSLRPLPPGEASGRIRLVLLSQTFPGLDGIVRDQELKIIDRLGTEFANHPMVALHFKPHPTQGSRPPPGGFRTVARLEEVNGRPGTVFVSQFSTCQIDPTFKGRKYLVRGGLVHPEIAFDRDQPILDLDGLVAEIRNLAATKPVDAESHADD